MSFGSCKNLRIISDDDKHLNVGGTFIELVDLVGNLEPTMQTRVLMLLLQLRRQ